MSESNKSSRGPRNEPAFTVFHDELQDWGVAALERAAEGLRAETAVHICYGYGIEANNKWKETLGAEWRQYEQSFPLLQQSSIDIVSLECIHSHVPLELVGLIRGKKVMLGAIDVATETVQIPEEVAEVLRRAIEFVDADKLIPSSNCGMAPLAPGAAPNKLGAVSAGGEIVWAERSASFAFPEKGSTTDRGPVLGRREDQSPHGCPTAAHTRSGCRAELSAARCSVEGRK